MLLTHANHFIKINLWSETMPSHFLTLLQSKTLPVMLGDVYRSLIVISLRLQNLVINSSFSAIYRKHQSG